MSQLIETYRERRAETAGLTAILEDRAKAILFVSAGRGSRGGPVSGSAGLKGRGRNERKGMQCLMPEKGKQIKGREKMPPVRADLALFSLRHRKEPRRKAERGLSAKDSGSGEDGMVEEIGRERANASTDWRLGDDGDTIAARMQKKRKEKKSAEPKARLLE